MGDETFSEDVGVSTTQSTRDSPIGTMPPELLAEVFSHCASVEPFSPVQLSHVSMLWRETAITTPSLWHTLSARIPSQTPEICLAKINTWLARSGAFPLHVSLILTEWQDDDNTTFWSSMISLRDRSIHWSRLTVIAASYTIACQFFHVFVSVPGHAPLYRIDLRVGSPLVEEFDDEEPLLALNTPEDEVECITTVFAYLSWIYAPRFTEFNLGTSALPNSSWLSLVDLGFTRLRSLRIFERKGMDGQIGASSLLGFLEKCPALEKFIFKGSSLFDPLGTSASVVELSHLRELHLAQTCHQRAILAHLCTPALEVLRLSWLNRPEMFIDESYVPDPSEQNEEPVEWSQSQFTDLLTGAGIRSLISCSNPPIRILDMDFADARSPKDFVWMFEHLPTLESFRIVGSDMSNKVLYALASKNQSGKWLCPRLTSLDFSRCDVITGKGVVALAMGRNPCVDVEGEVTRDVSAGEPRPARLTKFVIEVCAGVDCESIGVMQHLIGDVDYEVEVVPL